MNLSVCIQDTEVAGCGNGASNVQQVRSSNFVGSSGTFSLHSTAAASWIL